MTERGRLRDAATRKRDALDHMSVGLVVRRLYGERTPSRAEDRGALRGV